MNYIPLSHIKVAEPLHQFVEQQVLPGLAIQSKDFWNSFDEIIHSHSAENTALLKKRDQLQQQLDDWYKNNTYDESNLIEYKKFLTEIGYLLPEGEDFEINVSKVDREISTVAGPQLVVPINNARFAINAANARWGSLYDALYGSDLLDDSNGAGITSGYNEKRGQKVFDFCNAWLDEVLPLENSSHANVKEYRITKSHGALSLEMFLTDNNTTFIEHPQQLCGYSNDPRVLLFKHNNLYFELHIDHDDIVGSKHPAGLKDVVVEAAVTTIQDCEDSVAAVDVEDKVQVYQNWLQLIQGTLSTEMSKGGKVFTRRLNEDRKYLDAVGHPFSLPGRSTMLVRNTGMHMKTDLALTQDDQMVPEGLVDALMTVLISSHDFQDGNPITNSKQKSIYIVKPKLHGPEEVAFTCKVFSSVEQAYGLPANTIKIGVMDEERRTTINLKECIRAAKDRIIFINTGFLDRTGDEIHTSMLAGPMLPKAEIKNARWMPAYENWNVDTGLLCGLSGKAQIGKGMWAIPDNLKDMYDSKIAHPKAGANCAWVPSPTAATLHALHYHQVSVKQRQVELKSRERANIDHILSVPLLPKDRQLSTEEIQKELDNNAQGILGYVVKWIDMGIGCSKVPDIDNVGLMEDRATLRISSQHMANWLQNGLCTEQQIMETFKRMAVIVDQQNAQTGGYSNMASDYQGAAFEAAVALVLEGVKTPNGYTEDLLQQFRRKVKQS